MESLLVAVMLMIFILWGQGILNRNLSNVIIGNSTNEGSWGEDGNTFRYQKPEAKLRYKRLLASIALFLACFAFVRIYVFPMLQNDKTHSKVIINNDKADSLEKNQSDKPPLPTAVQFEVVKANKIQTTFKDVAGLHEAKEELQDIVKFLQNPEYYRRLGAKSPTGVLMYGAPGTGKTLLARSVAGEAKVNFIATSGSEFEQEYVGVGASRIRQLFELARKNSPCVIFIDEIDAVAFKRSQAKHAFWAIQTINQLLSEMDGFDDNRNEGVLVIAASNYIEALDHAILRPGRFDRHVKLDTPTLQEREEIINVYLPKVAVDNYNLAAMDELSNPNAMHHKKIYVKLNKNKIQYMLLGLKTSDKNNSVFKSEIAVKGQQLTDFVDKNGKLDLQNAELTQKILTELVARQHIAVGEQITAKKLAQMSSGFTGADIANWLNEAAIIAVKANKHSVSMEDFDKAKDRIILGSQRKSLQISDKIKKLTAYHEAGHALVGHMLAIENGDKTQELYKVTIAPRGPSLGHTSFEPKEDQVSISLKQLEAKIATLLAGRIAEQMHTGEQYVTTGAEDDLKKASQIAYYMVTRWGYSDKVGLIYHDNDLNLLANGLIEQEVKLIIKQAYAKASKVLANNSDKLHALAAELLEHETLDNKQVQKILG